MAVRQAAINASQSYLPANLPSNPSYRKVNPADSPIMIIGLTSDKYDKEAMYDSASTIMEQKLSQIQGVGQVGVGGASYPSVRVDVNPPQLNHYGITLATIQRLLGLQNSDLARGQITNNLITADIVTNGQISKADEYKPLIVGYHNGLAVHLSDVADVQDQDAAALAAREARRVGRGPHGGPRAVHADDHKRRPVRAQLKIVLRPAHGDIVPARPGPTPSRGEVNPVPHDLSGM